MNNYNNEDLGMYMDSYAMLINLLWKYFSVLYNLKKKRLQRKKKRK